MRFIALITIYYWALQFAQAQVGFSQPIDIGLASGFSSLEYKDGVVSVYGTIFDPDSPPYWDLLFYRADTAGNVIDTRILVDSIGDDFTLCYPNSFIQLIDGSGFAGIGVFFYRESGYLALYNNDGTVRRFVEYGDSNTLTDFYIEVLEVLDGFFILGNKQLNDFHSHIFLMKTDKEGNKLWEKLYGHPIRENYYGSIVKVNDNQYVIGGATAITPSSPQTIQNTSNFYVIDSLGNLKSSWQSQPGAADMGVTYGMQQTPQMGWVYAAVELRANPPQYIYESRLKIIERDSVYNLVNEKIYGDFGRNNIQQNFKRLSNSDYLMLGSRTVQFSSQTQYPSLNMGSLFRLSPNGDSIWNLLDTAFGLAQNRILDAVELPSGSIIACGYSRTNNPIKDWAWLVKVSKDGCVDTLNCITVSQFESPVNTRKIRTYPNPAFDMVYIDMPDDEHAEYQIYSFTGSLVKSGYLIDKKIDISTLIPGSYVLQVRSKNGIVSKKVIKV